jgi:hypothetical protein
VADRERSAVESVDRTRRGVKHGAAARARLGSTAPPPDAGFVHTTVWLMTARWRIAFNSFTRGARWRRLTYAAVAAALAFLAVVAFGTGYIMTRVVVQLGGDPASRDPAVFHAAAAKADVIVASTLSGTLMLSLLVSFWRRSSCPRIWICCWWRRSPAGRYWPPSSSAASCRPI